jgi:AcrR family transcriptional regulator
MFDIVSIAPYAAFVASLSQRTADQEARRNAVEARVLAATEALLADGAWYADLSVEQIARRAGLSRTAFYFYFRDKRELLMRLTEDVSDLLYAQAETWWSGHGDGPAEVREALEGIIDLYREHGRLLNAVVEASAYDAPTAGFWRAMVGRFVEATRRRIEQEQAAGRIGPLAAEHTAAALCWMTERALYQRIVAGGNPADPEFADALIGTWVRALYGRVN